MTKRTGEKLNWVRRFLLISTGVIATAVPILSGVIHGAQITPKSQPPRVTFEVASVKVNTSGDRVYATQYLPSGRVIAKNVPVTFLIMDAYSTSVQRIIPSPGVEKNLDPRVMNGRYDIEAVAEKTAIPPGATAPMRNEKLRLMLQSLLADRFKLGTHREVKDGPVYALVVAKNGPKLQKARVTEQDCAQRSSDPSDPASCHVWGGGQGQGIRGEAIDISDLAHAISNFSDRPIIDKTGLTGLYNIQTSGWVDMRNVSRPPAETEAQKAEAAALADPSRPTIFIVLDQLGLKLEQRIAPIETLFIDHIEPPTGN